MLYINIYIFITCIYLSDDRKNINGFDVDDYYGLVICCGACFRRHRCRLWRRSTVRRNGRNGNGHSCCEEEFDERSAIVVVACGEMFLSGLHNCECLYGSFRFCTEWFQGMRTEAACGETTVYHVPIYERQLCQLACISLYSLIRHASFLWRALRALPALAPSRRASPLLPYRAVNADKRYPRPWPPLRARRAGKPVLNKCSVGKDKK